MKIRTIDIILLIGKKESGKSVCLKYITYKINRKIFWDYNWEHGNCGFVLHDLSQLVSKFNTTQPPKIVYQPLSKTEDDFNRFIRECQKIHNVVLIVEEIEVYARTHYIPPALKNEIDIGRHYGRGLICTARRPAMLHGEIPYNTSHIIVFKMQRPQDIEYISQYVGMDAYKLKKAPDYSFLWYNGKTTIMHNPLPYKTVKHDENKTRQHRNNIITKSE